MYLEQWQLGQLTGNSSIANYQLAQLKTTLDYVYRESPFYRDLLNRAGIEPSAIASLEHISLLPFTTADDLRSQPYRFLCVSLSKIKRVFTLYTGGTSGAPKMVFLSDGDIDRITDYMGTAMLSVALSGGVGRGDFKVYILLPDGKPESQQRTLARGVDKVGGVTILGDLSLSTEEQMARIAESSPDILFGPVSRIYRMTLKAKGECDLSHLGVRILFLTSEHVPPAMRGRLQELWNAQVFTHYGMTEMGWAGGIECQAHDGLHFNELDLLLEVIDPQTGEVIKDDREGELVLTTLNREAMPLIRYRTGDSASMTVEPCSCGASQLRRVGIPVRKKEAFVKLASGEVICPTLLDDAIFSVSCILDYRSSLIREGDKDRLAVQAEVVGGFSGAVAEIAASINAVPQIKASIEAGTMDKPHVEVVGEGLLKRRGRAKRLIVDER